MRGTGRSATLSVVRAAESVYHDETGGCELWNFIENATEGDIAVFAVQPDFRLQCFQLRLSAGILQNCCCASAEYFLTN